MARRPKSDCFHRFERARRKLPLMRRKEPRPAQRLARFNRLDGGGASTWDKRLQRYPARVNQVKMIRVLAFAEDVLADALHYEAFRLGGLRQGAGLGDEAVERCRRQAAGEAEQSTDDRT